MTVLIFLAAVVVAGVVTFAILGRRADMRALRRRNAANDALIDRLAQQAIEHSQFDATLPTIVLDEIARARKDSSQ